MTTTHTEDIGAEDFRPGDIYELRLGDPVRVLSAPYRHQSRFYLMVRDSAGVRLAEFPVDAMVRVTR